MAETSKELLDQPSKPSLLEGLLLGRNDSGSKPQKKKNSSSEDDKGRVLTTEVPKSQVLGKVKDFLGVMAKANKTLELNAQGTSRSEYDIEVLNGDEQEYIEMDLLLGVADLHTPSAIAAAEAAISGFQPSVNSTSSSSCSDSEDESDEDDDGGDDDIKASCCDKKPVSEVAGLHENKAVNKPNKRPKIVVLN